VNNRICAAQRIKEQRIAKGYTIEYLAELAEIAPRTLSYIENAENDMKISTLKRICDALNVSLNYVLTEEDDYKEEIFYLLNKMDKPKQEMAARILRAMIENE